MTVYQQTQKARIGLSNRGILSSHDVKALYVVSHDTMGLLENLNDTGYKYMFYSLYTYTRYNDKVRYKDNLTGMKSLLKRCDR